MAHHAPARAGGNGAAVAATRRLHLMLRQQRFLGEDAR